MEPRYDIQIMVQVAQMYYCDDFTQEQIAKQIGISRSSISMILSEAREFGIVEIQVKNPQVNNDELSKKFKSVFGVAKCFVVPTSITNVKVLTKIVATQGAFIAEKELKSHITLGVAWGSTCYECMGAFRNISNLYDIKVVPLIGGTNRISSEYQLNEMVRILAEKVQGTPSFIYAPALAESIDDKEHYMKSIYMKEILKSWANLDIGIVSVGAPPEYYNSKTTFDPYMMKPEFEKHPERSVGDICARRFNIHGEFLNNDYNNRVMGIGEQDLRNAKEIICIASGNHKVLSILGALRTKTIGMFITDENTARNVLDIAST